MKRPLRILLVEDSEDDVILLLNVLKDGGYDPYWQRVESAPAMKAALEEKIWDLVISDYNMPSSMPREPSRFCMKAAWISHLS